MSNGTYQRTLIEACNIAGDESVLAVYLHQPPQQVVEWLVGNDPVPVEVFLQAADMVTATPHCHLENAELFLKRIRRRHNL
jgi:hypothetical protein